MTSISQWKKAAYVLMFFWILITLIVLTPLRCSSGENEKLAEFQNRLQKASAQLDSIKSMNAKLIAKIKESGLASQFEDLFESTKEPPGEYEQLRRRVYTNVKELWNYFNAETRKFDNRLGQTFVEDICQRKRSLFVDLDEMRKVDGYEEFRKAEAANVSDLIQRRLHYLQNPPDCKAAKKILCYLNKGCGFGCQLHHLMYCLIFSYATERTLILQSKGWRYSPKGWESVFQPLSETCTSIFDERVVPLAHWIADTDDKVISLPFIDSILSKKPDFLPLAIPKDLSKRIMSFNGDPTAWWIGQMQKYVLRFTPQTEKVVNGFINKMAFEKPIVGIHVRRTDKVGTEASLHKVEEYMSHVADYYAMLETRGDVVSIKRVYLATDDDTVLDEAAKQYPEYKFIGDKTIARSANTLRRYSVSSLYGLLADLVLLSRTDFLVCTFSSQVCRMAYQSMQSNRVDASESVQSLDDIYYFGGQNEHHRVVVLPHKARDKTEISAEIGDWIGIAGNHWNGYAVGANLRTNQRGNIPWYKTKDLLVLYPFPEYKEVPKRNIKSYYDGNL